MRFADVAICVLGAVGGAGVQGCASGAPRMLEVPEGVTPEEGVGTAAFEYRVGPRDVLHVNVFGHPELSSPPLGEVAGTAVGGNGRIQLPLVGPVEVAGQSVEEVSATVEAALARYLREPHVDTHVVRFGSQLYLVVGEVGKPGAFPLERPTTALEALAISGGVASFANREQIAWVRGSFREENLRLFDASQLDPIAMQLVQPGDVIFVGRRSWIDSAEAARDVLPILQTIAIPISVALQAATLKEVL